MAAAVAAAMPATTPAHTIVQVQLYCVRGGVAHCSGCVRICLVGGHACALAMQTHDRNGLYIILEV